MFDQIPLNKQPEKPPKEINLLPPVWGRIPFEYVVVPKKSLSPKLKSKVEEIICMRALGQICLSMSIPYTGNHLDPIIYTTKVVVIAYCKWNYLTNITGNPTEEKNNLFNPFKLVSTLFIFQAIIRYYFIFQAISRSYIKDLLPTNCINSLSLPLCIYLYNRTNKLTEELGNHISDITNSGAAPFNIPELPAVLERYSHGIVDNNGNLILLKHPRSEFAKKKSAIETALLEFLWNQKFQRARFEMHQPRLREKEPLLAPLGPQFIPQPG